MKVYGIAEKQHKVYGHGDSGVELCISKEGGYGKGKFPPLFATREGAQRYLEDMRFNYGKEVVELELRDKDE